jgi:putative transposase
VGSIKSVRAKALGVNRKNIYRESLIDIRDQILVKDIVGVHKDHPAYGHKRVAWELGINHKRTARVMSKYGIKPPRRRIKKKWITVSTDNHNYINLIKDIDPDRPDFIFVSDLTYIKYQGGFIYLAGVEDVFTRELVSAGIGTKHNSTLALSTAKMAITKRVPEYFHSDQGTEFMAKTTTDFIEEKGVRISVSDKASPWQNGYKESFFGRFKEEFGDPNRYDSLGELIAAIYEHINYYNTKRIHTALKMPPVVFRQKVSDNCLPKRGT